MAIRVTTRSTASQQQAPLEAFGYNRNRADVAQQAFAKSLGDVASGLGKLQQQKTQQEEEAARLKAAADAEVEKRKVAADKVVVDNGYHLYTDQLAQAQANHKITLQGGTVKDAEGNDVDTLAQLQALNPQGSGFTFSGQEDLFDSNMYYTEGKTADALSEYRTALRELDLEKADIAIHNQIDGLDLAARNTIAEAKNKFAGQTFDLETYQNTVNYVVAFGETDLKNRVSERLGTTINTRAQALMQEIHTYQIDNATTEVEIDNIEKSYNNIVSQYTFLNPASAVVRNKAKQAKENLYSGKFKSLKSEAGIKLTIDTSTIRGSLDASPTDFINYDKIYNSVQELTKLVELHNNPDFQKRDLSLLTDAQLLKAKNNIAFGTHMFEIQPPLLYSNANREVLNEVRNLTKVKDYELSELVSDHLPQDGEDNTKYVSWRKERAQFIADGLKEGNLNVLNIITTNPDLQENIYTSLGYSSSDFVNIPEIEFNVNDVETSAARVTKLVGSNTQAAVYNYGFKLMKQKNATKDELLEGFVTSLAAIDEESTPDSVYRLTETVINLEQRSSKYGSIPKGIRDRVENLDVLTMLDDLAEQAFVDENNSNLSNMWERIKQGLIYQAYSIMQQDTGGLAERYEEAKKKAQNKGEKVAEFDMAEFDKYLRRELEGAQNSQLLSKIGFVHKSPEYGGSVYIHPSLYRTSVNTEVMKMKPGIWKNIITSDFIQGIQQGWANAFSNEPYKALLPQVSDRLYEVNFEYIARDEGLDLEGLLTPTFIKIAATAPEIKGNKETSIFYNNPREQSTKWIAKLREFMEDEDDLVEYLQTATVTTQGGSEIQAFRFSKVSSVNGQSGVLWEMARPDGSYEVITYPAENNETPVPYLIPFDGQAEIIRTDGLTIPTDADPPLGPGMRGTRPVEEMFGITPRSEDRINRGTSLYRY